MKIGVIGEKIGEASIYKALEEIYFAYFTA